MANESIMLDGEDKKKFVQIGPPSMACDGTPAVLWFAQARAEAAVLKLYRTRQGTKVLDEGYFVNPFLLSLTGDGLLAFCCKADSNRIFNLVAYSPDSDDEDPVILSAGHALQPVAACDDSGKILVVWGEPQNGRRDLFASFGPEWNNPFRITRDSWCSRPSVCAMGNGRFFLVWDQLSPQGGSVHASVVSSDGSMQKFEVFSQERASRRYLFPHCLALDKHTLVSAVQIQDITGSHGIIDQRHDISAVLIENSTGKVQMLESPANLDHGMLSDPGNPTELGYLGFRLRPRWLPGARLWWERKQYHDSPALTTEGVICCRDFDIETHTWNAERILHRGGISHDLCVDQGEQLWVAFRRVDPFVTYQLVLGGIESKRGEVSREAWYAPPGTWRPIEFPMKSRPQASEIERKDQTLKLFWGDPHVHTSISSDAEGEPDELMHYGRDLARLDFMAETENDWMDSTMLTEADRFLGDALSDAWSEEGKFIVLPGFEVTRPILDDDNHNHRNVLLPERNGKLFRWSDPLRPDDMNDGGPDHRDKSYVAYRAEQLGAILIAHHTLWTLADSACEAGVEVVSGWTTPMHNPAHLHAQWNSGRRFALIGGSDGHRRSAGLSGGITGVWAEELTIGGLLEAIRKRRTIASQGRKPLVFLELYDESGNRLFIGDHGQLRGEIAATIRIECEAEFEDTLEFVELRQGERTIANWGGVDFSADRKSLTAEFAFKGLDHGPFRRGLISEPQRRGFRMNDPFYTYLRIRQSGRDREEAYNTAIARGPWAWSTPIWWDWRWE